jgi:hypothetical protein
MRLIEAATASRRSCLILRVFLLLSLLWAVGNAFYVYVVLRGAHAYRVESAVYLFAILALALVLWRPARAVVPIELSMWQQAVLVVVVLTLWLMAFLPLLRFPFLSDDYVFLARYRTVADFVNAGQFFRPAFAVAFLALARLGGGSPTPFHVASLVLHLVSACLAYGLARRLFGSSAPALVVFTLFLLSPLQLEATLWISGLQELLWACFLMAALRCYTGTPAITAGRWIATAVLLACALLSKETAVCFVLLVPAADRLLFGGRRGRLQPWAYASFAVLLAGYLALRSHFTAPTDPTWLIAPSRYVAKQFLGLPYRFFAQPWSAAVGDVPGWIPCMVCVAILSLLFLAVAVRGTPRRVLCGPGLVLMTTLPLMGYFFVRADLMAARYLYLPTLGWALLVAELLIASRIPRGAFLASVLAIAGASALALQFNLRPWRAAGELVEAMDVGLKRGVTVTAVVNEWESRNGVALALKDGCPREYEGVGIFINGCAEFVGRARAE